MHKGSASKDRATTPYELANAGRVLAEKPASTHSPAEQQAKRRLGSADAYADARTVLAVEQAKRIEQIRLEAEGKLIESAEVRRLLVGMGQGLNVRLRGIEKRLRAAHPGLDHQVYDFVRAAHEDALGLLAADVLAAE